MNTNDHEVKKVKDMLIEIMLTGGTHSLFSTRWKYGHMVKFVKSRWEVTDAGKEWLDEHR